MEAVQILTTSGLPDTAIGARRLDQFAELSLPHIVVTVVLPLGIGIFSGALWDAIKLLFRRRKTPKGGDPNEHTVITIDAKTNQGNIRAVIDTDSEDVAHDAIAALASGLEDLFAHHARPPSARSAPKPAIAPGASGEATYVWNELTSLWVPQQQPDS